MRVFVSSTCYDLIDVRQEVAEELRGLGCAPVLSDDHSSEFEVSGAAGENSVATCLTNVRASDVVVMILSERYGRQLPSPPFDPVSATHLEYREAKNTGKRLYFYVRDRLAAEYALWRANGRLEEFRGAWVKDRKDHGLFRLIDEHQPLVQNGKADSNNWFDTFTGSFDLRGSIRKRFAPLLVDANAQQLIRSGQVPILVPSTPNIERVLDGAGNPHYRFSFEIVNAGPVAGIQVEAVIAVNALYQLDAVEFFTEPPATLAAALPGGGQATRLERTVQIEIAGDRIARLCEGANRRELFQWEIRLGSMTPSGYVFTDEHCLELEWDGSNLAVRKPPWYCGKHFVMAGDLFVHTPRKLRPQPSA